MMELKIKIEYSELFELIKQLPTHQINQLAIDLSEITLKRKERTEKQKLLRSLLLAGPVMSEEQYENYELNRKWINQWREIR